MFLLMLLRSGLGGLILILNSKAVRVCRTYALAQRRRVGGGGASDCMCVSVWCTVVNKEVSCVCVCHFFFGAFGVLNLKKMMSPSSTT